MSDIFFDPTQGDEVVILCNKLTAQTSDFVLDAPARRKNGKSNFRRALVHDQNDGLTVNYNGDYPGGLTLNNVTTITPKGSAFTPRLVIKGGIKFEIERIEMATPKKPKAGEIDFVGQVTPMITRTEVDLQDVINQLENKIAALTIRVLELEKSK